MDNRSNMVSVPIGNLARIPTFEYLEPTIVAPFHDIVVATQLPTF